MWIYNCNDQGNDAETTRSPALEISRTIVIIISRKLNRAEYDAAYKVLVLRYALRDN